MNERIKALADQAEDYATAEYEKWTPTHDFSGIPHIRKIFNEKFAELIVRECIEVGIADFYNHLPNIFPANTIRKHFGVDK